jgi:hypothetical protein
LFIDPGESTFLFGAAPRCAFSLLLLAVFLFRWQQRAAFGYWLFLPMTLIHQSQTGLFLAIVLALDTVQRPRAITRPAILLPIGMTIAAFVWRERVFWIVGLNGLGLAIVGLAAAPAALFAIRRWWPDRYEWFVGRVSQTLSRLHALSLPMADAILLAIGWFGLLLFTAIGNHFVAPEQSAFFWNHIAGRVLGTIRTEIVVAIIYAALGAIGRTPAARRLILPGITVMTLLIMPPAYVAWPPTTFVGVVVRNTTEMLELERQLTQPLTKITAEQEAVFYYALAKSVATGSDEFRGLR